MGATTRGRSRETRTGASLITLVVAATATIALGGDAVAATGPDLRVRGSAGGDVAPGVPFERSVTVTNAGHDAARDVHVLAWLPAGVRFSTVLPVFAQGTCTVISLGDRGAATLFADCRRDALAPGASAALRLPLVATDDASCGILATRIEVLADGEPAPNVDERNRTTIADRLACAAEPGPDLRVQASVRGRQPVRGGATVTYELEIANRGTETARDVRLTASLPRRLAVVGRPGGPSTRCTVASSVMPGKAPRSSTTCVVAHLEPDATATFYVRARVERDPACVEARMVATVHSPDEPQSLRGDNTDATDVTLACRPRIALHATSPVAAHPGDRIAVTVHARNVSGAAIGDVRAIVGGCEEVRRIDAGDGDGVLSPREPWTFRCARVVAGAADPATVPIVVVGRDAAHQVTVARALRRVDVWRPDVSVAVTSATSKAPVGTRATLLFRVANTGDAPLRDVVIDVPSVAATATVTRLGVGEARSVSLDVTLPRRVGALGEVTVSATDPLGAVAGDADTVPVIVTSAFTDGENDDGAPARDDDQARGGSAFTGAPPLGVAGLVCAFLVTAGVSSLVAARRRRVRD